MAELNFNLAGFQVQLQRQAVVSMRTLRALATPDDEPLGAGLAADHHKSSGGPGWFDSSWDLESGLQVLEGLPGDVRLNEWLTVCLRA